MRYGTFKKAVRDCAQIVCPQAVNVSVSLLHKNVECYGKFKPGDTIQKSRLYLNRSLSLAELYPTIFHELIHFAQYWILDETPNHGVSFRKYCRLYSRMTGLKID